MTAIEDPDSKSYSLFVPLIPAGALEAGKISIARDLLSPSLSTQLIVIHLLDRSAHPTNVLFKHALKESKL